jgi:hypothetical protein
MSCECGCCDAKDYSSKYRYGLLKRMYDPEWRSQPTYPMVYNEIDGFKVGVIQYQKKTKLPKSHYFDEISYDGYTMKVRTEDYWDYEEMPVTQYLCPDGLVSIEIDKESNKLVAIRFLEPGYLGLGEYSEWENIAYVLRHVAGNIMEYLQSLDTLTRTIPKDFEKLL